MVVEQGASSDKQVDQRRRIEGRTKEEGVYQVYDMKCLACELGSHEMCKGVQEGCRCECQEENRED